MILREKIAQDEEKIVVEQKIKEKLRLIKQIRKNKEEDEWVWRYTCYILYFFLCLAVADAKVEIVRTTEPLSTYQLDGTILNGLIFGHIVVKIDLKKLEDRRDEMVKLQMEIAKLPEDPSWSRNDRRMAREHKNWMNTTLENSIAKANISLESFQSGTWELVNTCTLKKCKKQSPMAHVPLSTSFLYLQIPMCFYNSM